MVDWSKLVFDEFGFGIGPIAMRIELRFVVHNPVATNGAASTRNITEMCSGHVETYGSIRVRLHRGEGIRCPTAVLGDANAVAGCEERLLHAVPYAGFSSRLPGA